MEVIQGYKYQYPGGVSTKVPVPPTTLVIGIVVIILLVAGVALGCYVYRMRKTLSLATGTIKKVTEKPLSGCRRLFSRMHKRT